MPPISSISNLNSRLSVTTAQRESSANGRRLSIKVLSQSSAPSVRIVGAARPYQGGYRVNV